MILGGGKRVACNETAGSATLCSDDVPGTSGRGTTGDNIDWTEEATDWNVLRTLDRRKGDEALAPSAVEGNTSIPIEIKITIEIMNESQLPDG